MITGPKFRHSFHSDKYDKHPNLAVSRDRKACTDVTMRSVHIHYESYQGTQVKNVIVNTAYDMLHIKKNIVLPIIAIRKSFIENAA